MTPHVLLASLLLAQALAPATPPAPAPGAHAQAQPEAPQAFPTLGFDAALAEAQGRNLDLQVARERLEQSRELHWKAWSNYLPRVVATGTYTHFDVPDVTFQTPTGYAIRDCTAPGSCTPDVNPPPPPGLPGAPTNLAIVPTGTENILLQKQNTLTANVLATQPIFAPQAWFGILAARAGERQASDSVEATRRDILFGAAQAYYGAASLKQVVTIQQRQLAIARDHERDAQVRYDAGTVPKVSLLRAQIDRARAEQDLKRAENSYRGAKVTLATLLGRDRADFEVEVPKAPPPPQGAATLQDDALRLRPDVLATREQVTVAERNRDGTLARYLPTLGAFARWDYSNVTGFTGRSTFWTLGLQASWTILDGGLRESDARENASRVREAEAARDSTALKVRD